MRFHLVLAWNQRIPRWRTSEVKNRAIICPAWFGPQKINILKRVGQHCNFASRRLAAKDVSFLATGHFEMCGIFSFVGRNDHWSNHGQNAGRTQSRPRAQWIFRFLQKPSQHFQSAWNLSQRKSLSRCPGENVEWDALEGALPCSQKAWSRRTTFSFHLQCESQEKAECSWHSREQNQYGNPSCEDLNVLEYCDWVHKILSSLMYFPLPFRNFGAKNILGTPFLTTARSFAESAMNPGIMQKRLCSMQVWFWMRGKSGFSGEPTCTLQTQIRVFKTSEKTQPQFALRKLYAEKYSCQKHSTVQQSLLSSLAAEVFHLTTSPCSCKAEALRWQDTIQKCRFCVPFAFPLHDQSSHFAGFRFCLLIDTVQEQLAKGITFIFECLRTRKVVACNPPRVVTDQKVAARIGEAQNPGPSEALDSTMTDVNLIHVNPTAIHGKADLLLNLNPHILCCSETSATAYVQKATTPIFRAKGFSSVWSTPAPPHRESANPAPEIRGKATGLSLHTCFQARAAKPLEHATYYQKARLMRSFVQCGALVIQVVQIYGYPRPATDAKEATNLLLRDACCEAFDLNMPTIFVGDYNHEPMSLPATKILADHGYKSTSQLHMSLYNVPQPPTCRDATCNDAFLVSPNLLPMVQAVQVDQHSDFADHKPIRLILRMPKQSLTKTIMRRPQSWQDRCPQEATVARHYDSLTDGSKPQTFGQWAAVYEEAVHQAIRTEHCQSPEKMQPMHSRSARKPGSTGDHPIGSRNRAPYLFHAHHPKVC